MRLDASSAQLASIDPDLIRSLESQVSALSEHLNRPMGPFPEFEDIGPRLDDLEKSIAGSRDSILEAARQAAENAVRSFNGSQNHTAAVTGLAQDMRALEELTRRSDQRNAKTFEAIHDTLIKIVDRLGALDTVDAGIGTRRCSATPAPAAEDGDRRRCRRSIRRSRRPNAAASRRRKVRQPMPPPALAQPHAGRSSRGGSDGSRRLGLLRSSNSRPRARSRFSADWRVPSPASATLSPLT